MSEENKDFTVDQFAAGVRHKLGENSGIDATIKFIFDGGEVVFVDGKSVPNSVTHTDGEADVLGRCVDPVTAALRRLSDDDRELLTAFAEGAPLKSLTGQFGLSLAGVKTRAFRARRKLAEALHLEAAGEQRDRDESLRAV